MNQENINRVITFLEKYHLQDYNFVKIEKNILLNFIKDIPYEDFKKGFYIYVKSKNLQLRDIFIDDLINEKYLKSLFHKFYKKNNSSSYEYIDYDKLFHKIIYRHTDQNYYLGLIMQNLTLNHISNYYQLDNRLSCDLYGRKSAKYGFENETIPLRVLYRNVFKKYERYFNKEVFRYIFGYNYGIASNFSVNSAKLLYDKLKGKKIIDTSCGWGDRLAAFYLSYHSQEYVGMDPNPKVYEIYKKQIIAYEKFLENKNHEIIDYGNYFVSNGVKKVTIYNCGMEDFPYEKYHNYFDLYFTSPPYFNTELYSNNEYKENQSWYKYPTYDSWKNDFLLNTFNKLWKAMKENSYFCVNIIDPKDKKKNRIPLCDDMIDEILKYENANYIGFYGLRLSNISSKKEEMKKLMYEPIWIFKKSNNFNYSEEINKVILKKEGLF